MRRRAEEAVLPVRNVTEQPQSSPLAQVHLQHTRQQSYSSIACPRTLLRECAACPAWKNGARRASHSPLRGPVRDKNSRSDTTLVLLSTKCGFKRLSSSLTLTLRQVLDQHAKREGNGQLRGGARIVGSLQVLA